MTIDDTHKLEDFGLRATNDYDDPITFPFNANTMNVAGSDRTLLISEEIEPRPLGIPIKFSKDTHLDISSMLDDFADLFYDQFGKRKEVKVELDHWGGRYVKAYLETNINSDRLRGLGNITLRFICYDPYRYSPVTADGVTWGSEDITFKNTYYTFGHEGSPTETQVSGSGAHTIDLTVNGLAVHPEIVLEGSSDTLTISANDESIEVPAFSNSKWEIERYKALKDGEETFLMARNFILLQGRNKIRLSGNNKDFKISIRFRDKYK